MTYSDFVHWRLRNAVVSFSGADQHGSKAEIKAAAVELAAATTESQNLLYPVEVSND